MTNATKWTHIYGQALILVAVSNTAINWYYKRIETKTRPPVDQNGWSVGPINTGKRYLSIEQAAAALNVRKEDIESAIMMKQISPPPVEYQQERRTWILEEGFTIKKQTKP